MTTFTLTIETGNDAMQTPDDISAALLAVAARIGRTGSTSGKVMDANGNSVGTYGETTPDEKGYQGWTNYETWLTALWLDNEQDTYHAARDLAGTARSENKGNPDRARWTLGDALKEMVQESNPLDGSANVYTDLIGAALSAVNWNEIAENVLDGLDPETEDEEESDEE